MLTPIFVDWETYYDREYSLSKLTAIEYVTDPRFEEISCAIMPENGVPSVYWGHKHIHEALMGIDWSDKILVGHNMSEFDALIAAWKHGINPRMWGCTLAMARPIHDKGPGGSLKALAEHYGLPPKGELRTLGKHLSDLTRQERLELAQYNKQDAMLVDRLWERLRPETSDEELWLIDRTIRMLVEPQFVADIPLLEKGLAAERKRKRRALFTLAEHLNQSPDDLQIVLRSATKFCALLKTLGVEPPMKNSPKGNSIPAVAKTDPEMQLLLESPDDLVRMAAELRLDVKSTLLETRLARMISFAKACQGMMPIPLRYWGAGTGRWSGTMALNAQNLPRIPRDKDGTIVPKLTNVLRTALCAPEGHQVVVVDLSGIELRVNHFLWMEKESMELFIEDPEKADLYKAFASSLYKRPVESVTKEERQIGKIAQLGLGYGAGWGTFQKVAKSMGGVNVTDTLASIIVNTWRAKYPRIVKGWAVCDEAITWMATGAEKPIDPWGLCYTGKECIYLPKGKLVYPDIRQEDTKPRTIAIINNTWLYGTGSRKAYLYGAKLVENIVQALSRLIMSDTIVAFAKTPLGRKYPLAHMVHDELVYIVKNEDAEAVLEQLKQHMIHEPKWWPVLATWAEGDIAPRYGLAK